MKKSKEVGHPETLNSRNRVKINSDGVVSKFGEKSGGGAVMCDHNRAFLASVCHLFQNHVDPEAVEILACRLALQVAVECGVERVHLKLGNTAVVHMLNNSGDQGVA